MNAVYKILIDLCLLRASAEQIPYSKTLQYLSVLAYMLVGLVVSTLAQPMNQALLAVLVDTLMMLALAYAGLWVKDLTARGTQTITALAGTGALFGVVSLPILSWLQGIPADQPSLAALFLLGLIVWNVAVVGNILRSALDVPLWAGVGISVLYVYTAQRVMSALFIAGN